MIENDAPKLMLSPSATQSFEHDPYHNSLPDWEARLLKEIDAHQTLQENLSPSDHTHEPSIVSDNVEQLRKSLDDLDDDPTVHKLTPSTQMPHSFNTNVINPFIGEKSSSKKSLGPAMQHMAKIAFRQATGGMNYSDKLDDSERKILEWVDQHFNNDINSMSFPGLRIDESDEFARDNADAILNALLYKMKQGLRERVDRVDEIIVATRGIGQFTDEGKTTITEKGMWRTILRRPELLPGLEYNRDLLDKLMVMTPLHSMYAVADLVTIFPDVDWQELIDGMMKAEDYLSVVRTLGVAGDAFPVQLTVDQVKMLMRMDALMNTTSAIDYLGSSKGKKLLTQYSLLELCKHFANLHSINVLMQERLLSDVSEDEIFEFASKSSSHAEVILSHMSKLNVSKNEQFVSRFLDMYPDMTNLAIKCNKYSQNLQLKIFDKIKDSLIGGFSLEFTLVNHFNFTLLDEAAHRYILEHCERDIMGMSDLAWAKRFLTNTGATDATLNLFDTMYRKKFAERDEGRQEIELVNSQRVSRREAEDTYFNSESITLLVAGADEELGPEGIAEYFDFDHVVKQAPAFQDQVGDASRTNYIKCKQALHDEEGARTKYYTEQESVMIDEFDQRMKQVVELLGNADSDMARDLRSMYENLTFIGGKEYQEAVKGIATYWKYVLDTQPEMQLLLRTGIGDGDVVKSDEYMLDNIIAHFNDDELRRYAGRLITDPSFITHADPKNVRVIFVDDWTISGAQLNYLAQEFIEYNPQFESCVEVQLIAASKERIALGLEGVDFMKLGISSDDVPLPVRAYYMAHDAPAMKQKSSRGAHITGAHSSVDYGFDMMISDHRTRFKTSHAKNLDLLANVPLTNIVREYREDGYELNHLQRLKRISEKTDPDANKTNDPQEE